MNNQILNLEEDKKSEIEDQPTQQQPVTVSQTDLDALNDPNTVSQNSINHNESEPDQHQNDVGNNFESDYQTAQPLNDGTIAIPQRRNTFKPKVRQNEDDIEKELPTAQHHQSSLVCDQISRGELNNQLRATPSYLQTKSHIDNQKLSMTYTETQIDGASVFSLNAPTNLQNAQQQQNRDNQQDLSNLEDQNFREQSLAQAKYQSTYRLTCMTQQNEKFDESCKVKESVQQESNLVSCTDVAPSEHGFITVSQTGPLKVTLSEDESHVFIGSQATERELEATATFRAPPDHASDSQNAQNSADHEANSATQLEETEISSQIKQNSDHNLAQPNNNSQNGVQIDKNKIFTHIGEVQSHQDNFIEPPKMTTDVNMPSQAVSYEDYTPDKEKQASPNIRQVEMVDMPIAKKDSGLSSDQITHSAIEKGNLIQTDLSEPCVNHDSQHSSHASQYFHQIVEPEDINKNTYLKDASPVMDQEGYDTGAINNDLVHLRSNKTQKEIAIGAIQPTQSGIESSDLMREHSKESTEMNQISSQFLEYSKSNIAIDIQSKRSQRPNVTEHSEEVPWSLRCSAEKNQTLPCQLECTPQFQGASSIINDSQVAAEDNPPFSNQQQPNYESDQGEEHQTSRSSRFSKQHHSKMPGGELQRNSVSNEEVKMIEIGDAGQGPYQKSSAEIQQFSPNYEVKNSLDILTQSSYLNQSNETPISAQNIVLSSKAQGDIIKIINEDHVGEDEGEESVAKSSRQTKNNTACQRSKLSSVMQDTIHGRASSRFSKGLNDELDRVAENIHRSIAQPDNSSQTITGESFTLQVEDGKKSSALNESQMPYDNYVIGSEEHASEQRQDSSCLPRHARSVSKKSQGSQKIQKRSNKLPPKKGPGLNHRIQAHEVNMIAIEQYTPDNKNFQPGGQRNEPRLPDNAVEARQIFSTPRRVDGHFSPNSDQNPTNIEVNVQHESTYPVEIRKHNVIRGPVLRDRDDLTDKTKGLKALQKQKAKVQKQLLNNTGDSIQVSPIREARAVGARLATSKNNTISNGSLTLSRSNERSSECLPKKRIKKRGGLRIHSNDDQVDHNESLQEKLIAHSKKEGKASVQRKLTDAKKDIRIASKKHKEIYAVGASNKWKSYTQTQGQNLSTRMSHQGCPISSQNISVSEMNDLSLISNKNQNKNALTDLQYFDKKITPRCPIAISLQNSSLDFNDWQRLTSGSNNASQQKGQQQAIKNLPIDIIYHKLSQNWNKDKMMFEQRCLKVLNESKIEAQHQTSTMITNEEVKNRKQRFELLKQRLLANQSSDPPVHNRNIARGRGRVPLEDSLAQQQAAINQNLKELDKIFSQQDQRAEKQHQIGQFQLITNKPLDRFNLPPSPSHSNPPRTGANWPQISVGQEHPISAHQSHIQLRQLNAVNFNSNTSHARQRSQVLSPSKLTGNFLENNSNNNPKQVLAINATPINEVDIQAIRTKQEPSFEPQSKSLNQTATNLNFKSGRVQNINYQNQVATSLPKATLQAARAATANNPTKKRTSNFVADAFASSAGFMSNDSMEQRNKRVLNIAKDMPQQEPQQQNISNMSPSSIGTEQNRLIQKLQYRSMRGRRIQEFLKQVQSQKLRQTCPTSDSGTNNNQPEQEYQDVVATPSEGTFSSGFPFPPPNQVRRPTANSSDYSGTFLSNKLNKKTWTATQSDCGGESNPSIAHQQQSSSRDKEGLLTGERKRQGKSVIQSFDSGVGHSEVIKSFLAEQDKRIDFGQCPLYQKVLEGNQAAEVGGDDKILSLQQLEQMMSFIKKKNMQICTREFLLRSHKDCFKTIQILLTEQGMGYRATRMERDESQIDIERVYVMTCRAHKLHRARKDLVEIFLMIQKFEALLFQVKQLSVSRLASASSKSRNGSRNGIDFNASGNSDEIVINQEDDGKLELEDKSSELRALMSRLVISIPNLLKSFKFFNDSFVFNDKDYLKYLSKEFIELKSMLVPVNISF